MGHMIDQIEPILQLFCQAYYLPSECIMDLDFGIHCEDIAGMGHMIDQQNQSASIFIAEMFYNF